jgi:hypothetical protein
MFREVLQSIENSQVYSIIGLCLFIAAFCSIVYQAVRMDKNHVEKMSRLPIESTACDREEPND